VRHIRNPNPTSGRTRLRFEKIVMKRERQSLVVSLAALWLLAAPARADMYGFTAITSNSPLRHDVAEQLSLEVTGYAGDQVLFTFANAGAIASSITDVYFDDGALLHLADIINTPGVVFQELATPSNLPGGAALDTPFLVTEGFSADSQQPVPVNGVNPGESLGIVFDLQEGKALADVLAAIQLGFTNPADDGSLRIGIHVQQIGGSGGTSDSFIAVPVAPAVLLGVLGFAVAGLKLRKYV